MSHFRLMAIGFDEESIHAAMERYYEGKSVPQYVRRTKEQIIEEGKEVYAERCECIKAYEADPETAAKKYGRMAKNYYENRNDPERLFNISDPYRYYEEYIKCYVEEDLDEDGNVLSQYNPDSRWDYFTVLEELTIGDMKKNAADFWENYDSTIDRAVWNHIVNGVKMDLDGVEYFSLMWQAPSREEILKMYGSEDNYIDSKSKAYAPAYAVLTSDGEWHEPGKVGWFGISSASQESKKKWIEEFYKLYIEPYTDDTPVLFIDCHI